MRFVLVSTHADQTTGYSKVSHNLLKQLATLSPKVKTFHFGFQRHPNRPSFRKALDKVSVYDAAANEDPREEGFGFNKIHEYLEMVEPDVVMIYNDPLVIHRFVESMKHERGVTKYKLWVYVDQVYEGIAAPLIKTIADHADRVYCFTEIWKKVILEYSPLPDVRVLEHAVDPTVFTNMLPDQRKTIRAGMNVPEDATVFLNANRNSQRKRLDLTVAGFVKLLANNPGRKYYLAIVTNLQPNSAPYYDIPGIYVSELKRNGLDLQAYAMNLLLVDTSPANVIGDDGINQIYNAADIGINTSDGEGYGLCQLEHMYTGAPQIVTDIGSYRSFLSPEVAEFIPKGDRIYHSAGMPLGAYSYGFLVDDIAKAMETMIKSLRERNTAVSAYQFKSWSQVCDSWLEDVLTA